MTDNNLALIKWVSFTQELKKAGKEARRDQSSVAGKEDGSSCKKNTAARKDAGFSGKANTAAGKEDGLSREAKEQQNDRWFNRALEESTTIHLVKEVLHEIFGWYFFGWIIQGPGKGCILDEVAPAICLVTTFLNSLHNGLNPS